MRHNTKLLIVSASVLSALVFGAAATDLNFFTGLVTQLQSLVNLLVPLVIAIGLLLFIWGLVQYIVVSGDEAATEEGRRKMVWGVIALFVIVSVWGLVALLGQLTGVGQNRASFYSPPISRGVSPGM